MYQLLLRDSRTLHDLATYKRSCVRFSCYIQAYKQRGGSFACANFDDDRPDNVSLLPSAGATSSVLRDDRPTRIGLREGFVKHSTEHAVHAISSLGRRKVARVVMRHGTR